MLLTSLLPHAKRPLQSQQIPNDARRPAIHLSDPNQRTPELGPDA